MATTYSLAFVTTPDTQRIDAPILDPATFASGVTTPNAQGGEDTIYRHLASAPNTPTTLRVGYYPPTKAGLGTNTSAKLRAVGVKTDGDGVESFFPLEGTIAFNDGSNGMLDRDDVAAFLMLLVSAITVGKATPFAPNPAMLEALAVGATDVMPVLDAAIL